MRVTADDDDESISASQRSTARDNTTNDGLMVVTRQPLDTITQHDPTKSPSVSALTHAPLYHTPFPDSSPFKDQSVEESLEFGPTLQSIEDHMKYFFEGKDTWEDESPLNCFYLADGTLP